MQFVGGDVAIANRERFLIKQGISPREVVAGQLVNGKSVQIVTREMGGEKMVATDGLIATDPPLWLSITVADCLPIVIYNKEVVALLHGGWRGLDGGIIEEGVKKIREELIIDSELKAYVGPGIAQHHYPIANEIAEKFLSYEGAIAQEGEQVFLDLRVVARQKLEKLGIKAIEMSEECTYCEDKYFSARRDKTNPVEAMMVMVKI